MNRHQTRPMVVSLMLLGLGLASGCRNDPESIFHLPRSRTVRVERPRTHRGKAPARKITVPPRSTLPESNGIDVPIVQPD